MSNAEQAEEIESLQAIYGEDCAFDDDARTCRVYLPSRDSSPVTVLRALLPASYPAEAGPLLEIEAPHIRGERLSAAVQQMEQLFAPGEVCLFTCIEWLREQLQHWQDQADADAAELAAAVADGLGLGSSGRGSSSDDGGCSSGSGDEELQQLPESSGREHGRELTPAATAAEVELIEQMRSQITSGEPVTERRSTFQAHVAAVTDVAQVRAVVAVLLENNKIRNATHNIMAYRIAAPERPGVFFQDFDDDGEAAAGGRLLHLLQVADVRNAVVVVSRWFGGVLLGPARFGLINNTARQLLEATGFLKQQGAAAAAKKQQHRKRH